MSTVPPLTYWPPGEPLPEPYQKELERIMQPLTEAELLNATAQDVPTCVMGVDPGAAGGLAIKDAEGYLAHALPKTERDTWDLFDELAPRIKFAVIEKVHSMPGQGVASTFAFGRNYGFLRACLIAAQIPFEEVTPTTWQKAFGLTRKAKTETSTAKKNRHKQQAQQMWPREKVTHAKADAILLAEWAWRTRGRPSK